MRVCHIRSIALLSIIALILSVAPVDAADPSISGAVVVQFGNHSCGMDCTYWALDGISNSMLLTIPAVTDITVNPAAIGPATVSWSDTSTWSLPTIDMSGFSVGQTGSGSFTATVNGGKSTLDLLVNAGGAGPSEGDSTFFRVELTNVQPSGQPSGTGTNVQDSNFVSTKFNVTIPTGAHVNQPTPASAPIVENLTIQSGASLNMTTNSRVRHTLTNHGSGTFNSIVGGDFINDALAANGDHAMTDGLSVQGQLQNTGDLELPGYLTLQAATSNAGTITVTSTSGSLSLSAALTNAGTINLASGGSLGGTANLTNNGSLQWSDAYISIPLLTNNSNSFTITGSGIHRSDATITNNGTITQSSTASPSISQINNQAGALYDIINDTGLTTNFGAGAVANAGTFRKSAGTGSSDIDVPFTNSGTIDIHSGTVSFNNTLTLAASGTLKFQLSGNTPGTSFGKIYDIYSLPLAGALQVTLSLGFAPALGNSFDLFDLGGVSGAFSSLQLPLLASGLEWDTSQLYATGVLSVVAGLPGDFNQNGVFDAADYVVWRKGLGTTYVQADYNVWRTHFGQTAGGGAGTIANTAVPEPTTLVMVIIGALAMSSLRCADASQSH
jgi:hypothetical protein